MINPLIPLEMTMMLRQDTDIPETPFDITLGGAGVGNKV